ncbi:MAG: hypothetical protein A3I12_01435 [Gammaproteobacteria bacterium RIFCSPLOWO2_02_FULL_38_11]|nr:MAG: hypothetical protein A3I12_01435 [Gammaproteobacteria bacterium RIFCSPLOWO2_02_FULL_38_11]OGT77874.1 MAG: hypothetical protein A3G71_02160 [Gammaproteobacteria bacterium RIFCSPLOWO2_12_FULL_38_14]
MNKQENFNTLVEQAMRMEGRTHMRPVIEKELFHYDILFALDSDGLLDRLTFQGGTSLRLCYGAPRFSEDLDFAGGKSFKTADLMMMKDCIEEYLGKRYGLQVTVKEPKEMAQEIQGNEIKVDKWQISITTSPGKKDLPKQRIKIEVINIPSYSRTPQSLKHNYDFLPDGYSDILVMTETLDEIMADKLISFVNCNRTIRHRDIWDLRWLKQQGAKINAEFILKKINDYYIADYSDRLSNRLLNLSSIVKGKAFYEEMSRFIPDDIQEKTLKKEKFLDFLNNEIHALLLDVQKII